MKREEAINYLNHFVNYYFELNRNKYGEKYTSCTDMPVEDYEINAMIMAIEALKEMSVEEYRQRLMDVFHSTDHDELLTYVVMPKEEEFKSLEYILSQYKFEPRLHGKWIVKIHRMEKYICCSKCGREIKLGILDFHKFPNFCPNCGCKMVDKQDDLATIIEAVQILKEGEENGNCC